jgi:hypothetical protein
MSRRLVVHIASGLGIVSLAVFFLGLIPFLSIDPSAGAGLLRRTPALSVNREFKGDRLPIAPVSAASRRAIQQHPEEIPVGCDAAFSPISAPRLAYIYRRCTT